MGPGAMAVAIASRDGASSVVNQQIDLVIRKAGSELDAGLRRRQVDAALDPDAESIEI